MTKYQRVTNPQPPGRKPSPHKPSVPTIDQALKTTIDALQIVRAGIRTGNLPNPSLALGSAPVIHVVGTDARPTFSLLEIVETALSKAGAL